MKRRRLTKGSDLQSPPAKTARRTSAPTTATSSSHKLSQRSPSPSPPPGKRPLDAIRSRTTRTRRSNARRTSQSSQRLVSDDSDHEESASNDDDVLVDEKENLDRHRDHSDEALDRGLLHLGALGANSDEDDEIAVEVRNQRPNAASRTNIDPHISALVNFLLGKQARGEAVRMTDVNKFKISSQKGSGKKNLEAADAILKDVFGIEIRLFSRKSASEASTLSQEPKKHNVADDLYILEFCQEQRSERLKNLAQELLLPKPECTSAFALGILGIVLSILHFKSGPCEESFLREKLENIGVTVDEKVWDLVSKVFVKQLYLTKVQSGESKVSFKKGPRAEEVISGEQIQKFIEEVTQT